MFFEILNFKRIASARIEADPGMLTLICGKNMSGKTSALQAIRGLASRLWPFTQKELRLAQRHGAPPCVMKASGPGQSVTSYSLGGTVSQQGEGIRLSSISGVGVRKMDDKRLMEFLTRNYDAAPSRDDLKRELFAAGEGSDEIVDKLWKTIEGLGWDSACENAKQKGRDLKASWRMTAKEEYGGVKAESWYPSDWETDLSVSKRDDLVSAKLSAEETIGALRAIVAGAILNVEEAKKQAEKLPDIKRRLAELDTAIAENEAARNKEEDLRKALDLADEYKCPYCSEPLRMASTAGRFTIEKGNGQTVESKNKNLALYNDSIKRSADLTSRHKALSSDRMDVKSEILSAEKAEKSLETPPEKIVSEQEMTAAMNAAAKAAKRLFAFDLKAEADRTHRIIKSNANIVKILDADGLRLQKLLPAIAAANEHLKSLCVKAGWPIVVITQKLGIESDDKPLGFLWAESEEWRAEVLFEVMAAQREKADLVIIDRADILDQMARNGLVKITSGNEFAVVASMTVADKTKAPPSGKIVRTYYMNEGVSEEVVNA